jgi:hypothetical protein
MVIRSADIPVRLDYCIPYLLICVMRKGGQECPRSEKSERRVGTGPFHGKVF